jgi:hypothetical protein
LLLESLMGCEVVAQRSLATRLANLGGACAKPSMQRAKSKIQHYLQLAGGRIPAMVELHACVLCS